MKNEKKKILKINWKMFDVNLSCKIGYGRYKVFVCLSLYAQLQLIQFLVNKEKCTKPKTDTHKVHKMANESHLRADVDGFKRSEGPTIFYNSRLQSSVSCCTAFIHCEHYTQWLRSYLDKKLYIQRYIFAECLRVYCV